MLEYESIRDGNREITFPKYLKTILAEQFLISPLVKLILQIFPG